MNWAYLLCCRDGTFYAGWTNDLPARLRSHNLGKGAKYTRSRRPVILAYAQAFPTRSEAMRRECELKKLSRPEKEALAAGFSQEERETALAPKETECS